jgi:hypothetical protein
MEKMLLKNHLTEDRSLVPNQNVKTSLTASSSFNGGRSGVLDFVAARGSSGDDTEVEVWKLQEAARIVSLCQLHCILLHRLDGPAINVPLAKL